MALAAARCSRCRKAIVLSHSASLCSCRMGGRSRVDTVRRWACGANTFPPLERYNLSSSTVGIPLAAPDSPEAR